MIKGSEYRVVRKEPNFLKATGIIKFDQGQDKEVDVIVKTNMIHSKMQLANRKHSKSHRNSYNYLSLQVFLPPQIH